MKSWRSQIETPTLSRSHFQPRALSATGSATRRRSARATSISVSPRLLINTQPRTTNAETARSTPAPDGRLSVEKLKTLFAAPPVKTQP